MIDIREADRKTIETILRKHLPSTRVVAFGSRVRGTSKPHSDLDLAAMTDTRLSSVMLAALREAFMESELPFRVDVVDWAATSDEFRRVITRDAVPFFEP